MPKPAPLPETAQVIAEVIGREDTLRLAAAVRHRALYVPKRITPDDWRAQLIGIEQATKLSEAFGGLLLPLAKCLDVYRQERDDRMRAEHAKGKSIAWIAAKYGVTRRQAWTICTGWTDPRRAE